MFKVDDEFLASVGYNVASLSDEQKNAYKAEFLEELNARLSAEIAEELDEDQIVDLESIQDSVERAKQWLGEFHGGYTESPDFSAIVDAVGEDEGSIFYATALWLQDAVPGYGKIAEATMAEYQNELIKKREMAAQVLDL